MGEKRDDPCLSKYALSAKFRSLMVTLALLDGLTPRNFMILVNPASGVVRGCVIRKLRS